MDVQAEQMMPMELDGHHSELAVDPSWADACLTCGTCASACPIAGVDGLDPRKIVRMAVLGMDKELVDTQWPWKCTMCGKCEVSCPAGIQITALMRKLRGTRDRDKVPGPIHKGVAMCLERGNNLGIPKDDFVFLCEELGADGRLLSRIRYAHDVHGARVLVTVNSRSLCRAGRYEYWWKIFYAAGESWTIPSENWKASAGACSRVTMPP
jgi:Fe-S oxidoreductase